MAGDDAQAVYVIDSSGWISIDGNPDHNRILYFLTKLIELGRIKSPPEVWDELKRCNNVLAWIGHERAKIVLTYTNSADYLLLLGQITLQFPGMAGARGNKEKADPYVVATAAHRK